MALENKNRTNVISGPSRRKYYAVIAMLHLLLAVYSFTGILGKKAALYPFMSIKFILFYGGLILLLGIYAFFWQKFIRVLPLSVAFANKAIMVVWGLVWGRLFFDETITARQILGAFIVMAGIILYANSDKKKVE